MGRTDKQNFGWWSRLCRALVVLFLKMIPTGEAFDLALYKAMAPFITSIVVEVVIMRRGEKGGFNVWLEKRRQGNGTDDEWFCPGEILRPGEQVNDLLGRLIKQKSQGQVKLVHVHLLGGYYQWNGQCWYLVQNVALQLDGELDDGEWFSTSFLPPGLNERHRRKLIALAAQKYET